MGHKHSFPLQKAFKVGMQVDRNDYIGLQEARNSRSHIFFQAIYIDRYALRFLLLLISIEEIYKVAFYT